MCDIKRGKFLEVNMTVDDVKGGIEVFMHDVRMQIVDVLRWVYTRGSEKRGEGGGCVINV